MVTTLVASHWDIAMSVGESVDANPGQAFQEKSWVIRGAPGDKFKIEFFQQVAPAARDPGCCRWFQPFFNQSDDIASNWLATNHQAVVIDWVDIKHTCDLQLCKYSMQQHVGRIGPLFLNLDGQPPNSKAFWHIYFQHGMMWLATWQSRPADCEIKSSVICSQNTLAQVNSEQFVI